MPSCGPTVPAPGVRPQIRHGRHAAGSSAVALKDLYADGEVPPLGHVPGRMHAWAIRKERHGLQKKSMRLEAVRRFAHQLTRLDAAELRE